MPAPARSVARARANALKLSDDLRGIAAEARRFANAMDFRFLLNRRRKLLSVGYDVDLQELHSACYDLLATESRTAVFAAIAKEDIPQESWFMLGRAHTLDKGRPVLLSWTGTMFEYLMPAIWMRTYPNTLLDRSRIAVVRSQQAYTAAKRIPWGISESAHFKTDEAGKLPVLCLRASPTGAAQRRTEQAGHLAVLDIPGDARRCPCLGQEFAQDDP